jgi:acyl-coenzyme A synthetase/AMP-(fatty) acid ligase
VADSLVVGVPDPVKGSVLAAYIVPADRSLSVDELRESRVDGPGRTF